jgi:hypothetical protein
MISIKSQVPVSPEYWDSPEIELSPITASPHSQDNIVHPYPREACFKKLWLQEIHILQWMLV